MVSAADARYDDLLVRIRTALEVMYTNPDVFIKSPKDDPTEYLRRFHAGVMAQRKMLLACASESEKNDSSLSFSILEWPEFSMEAQIKYARRRVKINQRFNMKGLAVPYPEVGLQMPELAAVSVSHNLERDNSTTVNEGSNALVVEPDCNTQQRLNPSKSYHPHDQDTLFATLCVFGSYCFDWNCANRPL